MKIKGQLFKQHFIYWKRNLLGSLMEIFVPILLVVTVFFLMRISPITIEHKKIFSPEIYPLYGEIDVKRLIKYNKKCQISEYLGGKIGLIPTNDLTIKLAVYYQALQQDVIFFENEQELNDYIRQPDYNEKKNGKMNQLCFVIQFHEADYLNHQFDYSLKFNVSNPLFQDHYDTRYEQKLINKPDLQGYSKQVYSNGVLATQVMINSLIFKDLFHIDRQDIRYTTMPHGEYVNENRQYLQSMVSFLFIFFSSFIYMRTISKIVSDRESSNFENMENMGLRKIDYIKNLILWSLFKNSIYSLLISFLVKFALLDHISFLLIFSVYFIFSINITLIGCCISTFFINTKKALVYGMIIYFTLQIPYISISKLSQFGDWMIDLCSISPVVSMGNVFQGVSIHQNFHLPYNFEDLFIRKGFSYGYIFYLYHFIEIPILLTLFIYLYYVVPVSRGIPSHPLFFLKKLGLSIFKEKQIEHQLEKSDSCVESMDSFYNEEDLRENNVKIENLVKVYKNGKIAVKNVSMELYQNQILALLGHNGAGKTTLISMLTGLIRKTSGSVTVFGKDSEEDRNEVRKMIGVCHQKNTIFNYMTVYEHLLLYSQIKGVSQENLEEEIDQILKDLDLYHKKHYTADFLSGGQKRKLCVANAFIGGSKVIIMDEPTSGMDAHARRFLWDTIKKYKQDRIILITTHNMAEADYLGDRIAIMSDGQLKTLGTSFFLKQKYGTGYQLSLSKSDQFSELNQENLDQLFADNLQDYKVQANFEKEIKIECPYVNSSNFEKIFQILETEKDKYQIDNFGLSLNSLEDVFLHVTETFHKQNDVVEIQDTSFEPLNDLRIENKNEILKSQIKAFLYKKIIYYQRDIKGLVCELIVPIILLIIGIYFTNFTYISDAPELILDQDIYPYNFYVSQNQESQNLIDHFPTGASYEFSHIKKSKEFSEFLFQKSSFYNNYAFQFNQDSEGYGYNIYWNTTAPFSPYVTTQLVHDSLIKIYSDKKNPTIKTSLHPLIQTARIESYEKSIGGLMLITFIAFGFIFIPANLITFLIKERSSQSKHQQIVSGGSLLGYWLSHFMIDFSKYLFVMLVSLILIQIFGVDLLITRSRFSMLILMMFFNGTAIIWIVYLFSFIFNTPFNGQTFMFVFSYLFSIVMMILSMGFRMLPSTKDIWMNYVENILAFIPFYSFSMGLLNMTLIEVYEKYYNWGEVDAYDWRIAPKFLIYLIVISLISFLTLLILEYKNYLKFKRKHTQIETPLKEPLLNEDNQQEKTFIENNKDKLSVEVEQLVKIYGSEKHKTLNLLQNQQLKKAVKGISFGLKPGTVFGLLGTNGAGKTTTFKMMSGMLAPTSGKIRFYNFFMPSDFLELRSYIGYCPQVDPIISKLTVLETLNLYAKLKGIKEEYQKNLIKKIISHLGLYQYKDYDVDKLSGGNKRKVVTAIALLGNPLIVMMDEPTSGMDPKARMDMWNVMNQMIYANKNQTFIITTHSLEEAEFLCNKLAIIVEGSIRTIGSLQELKNKYNRGYEVSIKVMQIEKKLKKEIKKIIFVDEMDPESAKLNLFAIQQTGYFKDVNFEELNIKSTIQIEDFLERCDTIDKIAKMDEFMETQFDSKIQEKFCSQVVYQVSEKIKLSEIFGKLEKNQKIMNIQNYQVRECTLESIFVMLSKQSVHDDQVISRN